MSQQIPHIFVAHSTLHGQGVFTGAKINAGSIIEICPILYLPKNDIVALQTTIINDYYFEWGTNLDAGALALGYGSIYNHSFKPNAYYNVDMENNTLSIYALRTITPGDEITINYNGDPEDDSPLWFESK
ncbi:SET domain-containing protein [Aureispira anguillae]|uniref:SET domain-containing protein n=1 Tax=Aureispira anguillae TaxID=2864201 RepID=A0A915YGD2_9BACT|nr:SET domain-containing protein [Aureispira anguillae]BDS12547.1 SET domain-containing protein [Aureispira anguillae]